MCNGNPFCSIPPPIGLINMAANHVELAHNVTIAPEARDLLSDRITAAQPNLQTYLSGQGLSHIDLLHLAEKQFLQGLLHMPPTAAAAAPRVMDIQAVQAGINQKAWSDLWR